MDTSSENPTFKSNKKIPKRKRIPSTTSSKPNKKTPKESEGQLENNREVQSNIGDAPAHREVNIAVPSDTPKSVKKIINKPNKVVTVSIKDLTGNVKTTEKLTEEQQKEEIFEEQHEIPQQKLAHQKVQDVSKVIVEKENKIRQTKLHISETQQEDQNIDSDVQKLLKITPQKGSLENFSSCQNPTTQNPSKNILNIPKSSYIESYITTDYSSPVEKPTSKIIIVQQETSEDLHRVVAMKKARNTLFSAAYRKPENDESQEEFTAENVYEMPFIDEEIPQQSCTRPEEKEKKLTNALLKYSKVSNVRRVSEREEDDSDLLEAEIQNSSLPMSVLNIAEDTSSEDSGEETPRRRVIPRKKDKNSHKKKRPLPKKQPLVTTHKKLKTDDINQIQITMTTTGTESEQNVQALREYFEASKMTYRVMKRANFIIETVRQEKVIVDITKLMKAIKEDEQIEGYNVAIDKKSIMRLILKLSRDGYIKFRKAILRTDSKEKTVCFICDPKIGDDHSVIQSSLEQTKMKFFIGTISKEGPTYIEEKDLPKNSVVETIVLKETVERLQEDPGEKRKYKYIRNGGKIYGYCPKFVRTRLMHEYLFYMIYGDIPDPMTDREEIEKYLVSVGLQDDVFECDPVSPLHNKEVGWKMFLPPLPLHQGWPHGWTLLCDVLLRLPLQLFLKCFNVPYEIPDIRFYLDHPVRKFFLVKNLPPRVRNGLLTGRRYIFSMFEIATRLCHMGLLQFGPQRLKEKDQIFVFLNTKVTLLNTVSTPSSYHQTALMDYEKHSYKFHNLQDIEKYWYDLWSICINTNLGARIAVTGQFIVLEQVHTKPALVEACKPRTAEEAVLFDTGDVPGDKRGAAGLDSALFAHLKRNWNWPDLFNTENKNKTRFLPEPEVEKIEEPTEDVKQKIKKLKELKKFKKFKVKGRQPVRKTVIRQILPAKKKRSKRPMYDEKDKMCLKNMSKLRTDWTRIEDNVILLCTIANIYLCPYKRRQNVEYTIMRDVLHKMVPYSNDKTSRSCQRRINYIMKNPKTRRSVHMSLEEVRQCDFVIQKFGTITKKYAGHCIPVVTLNIAFVELVSYLNKKFSNQIPTSAKPLAELPDTIQEIKRIYEMTSNQKSTSPFFKDVESVCDINFDVIRSVIHSSLCCVKDKTSWAFQLFKIYQQYPEALLRSVLSKLRHEQMVSVKKMVKLRPNSSGVLPFSSPFQLSINYTYQLQNTRFCYEVFNEANTFLKEILEFTNNWDSKRVNDSLEITTFDNGTALLLVDIMQKMNLNFKFDHPEQVIVLHPQIANDTAYERIVQRYNDILSNPANIKYWEDQKPGSDEEFEDFDEEVKNLGINSSMIPRSSSRIAFHMMRADMCEGIDKNSAQHVHDYFVVNASRVFLEVSNRKDTFGVDLRQLQTQLNVLKVLEAIKRSSVMPDLCGKVTTDAVRQFYPHACSADFEYIEKIKCYILNKEGLGATVSELKSVRPDSAEVQLDLGKILQLLQTLQVVLKVGTTVFRYVHFDYKSRWVVSSTKVQKENKEKHLVPSNWKGKNLIKSANQDLGEGKELKLVIAPWVRLDGTTNRRVLDRWLGSVLSFVIEEPGISLLNLTHRYDYLKPVEIMNLVQHLHTMECIKMIKVVKPKITLFTEEFDLEVHEANLMDDPNEILLEPEQDAVYKMGIFIGQKNYSVNFLD